MSTKLVTWYFQGNCIRRGISFNGHEGFSKVSLEANGGDAFSVCFCCWWNVLISGRCVSALSFDLLKEVCLEPNCFESI